MSSFYFQYNMKRSTEFNIKILESNHRNFVERDVEFISVPGRTGDLIIDNGRTLNFDLKINCVIDRRKTKDMNETLEEIEFWLREHVGYRDILFKDGKRLKATCVSSIEIINKKANYAYCNIIFKAYKED